MLLLLILLTNYHPVSAHPFCEKPWQASRWITGTVTDEPGSPLTSASVFVKGHVTGTVTAQCSCGGGGDWQCRTGRIHIYRILSGAPFSFRYEVPDAARKYHFTVKLLGDLNAVDRNYCGTIYSPGQTVTFNDEDGCRQKPVGKSSTDMVETLNEAR